MDISEVKELRRQAEEDITRILYDLAAKVDPARLDIDIETHRFIDSSRDPWELKVDSVVARIIIEI